MSTLIEDGLRVIQYLDQAGNPSEKIPTGEGRSRVTIEDGTGRGGTSVIVERWDDRNELTVPRTQSEVQPAACCLDTAVVPSEAAAAGCTAAPTHTDGECDTQVEVTANAAEGWIFSHWSGAASGTDATAMALMDGELPACSVATAHFIEEEATSTKRAIALPVTSGVYPDQGIYYKIGMTWLGPESAFIGIQDPYPWSRVAYITDTLDWGSYVSQCEHDDVDHEITCTGLFPESETGISTYAAFETRTTCDLYTTEDPHGSVRNTARVQIGDYIFNPVDETEVFVPFRLKASTPNFLPNSDFSPGQTVLLYTVPKGDEPDCCTSCALDVYVVVDGNTANPLKMENQAEGVADRNQADFVKDDCHHSLWFEPTEDRTYILDLYVVNQGDPFEPYYLADTLHLAPTSTPELVVYTDLRELFNEFEMTDDKSPTTDSNGNCILDYYDALARMVRYAEEQKGVLIDVRQDAYTADHVFYNSLTTRQTMGEEIDENVTAHLEGFKLYLFNIAIIGDDAVVPFYRMETPDTVFDESDYLSSYGSNGNPTLYDTQYPSGVPHGYYMSDLPYATYEATLPHDPKPNISIGRIYYETPLALSQAIEAYEQPIDVRPGKSSAALFYLANEKGLRWEDISERAIKPLLHNHYGSGLQENVGYTAPESFEKQRAYLYSGGTTPWNAITTTRRAVVDTDFVFFNSHANQFGWETEAVRRGISNTRDIDFTDLTGATMDVAISTGCHAGYNPAFYQYDGTYPLYRQNMVRAMLDHHVAYYAPSTYGYGDNTVTSHHDLLTKNFLSALFNRRYDKVGDAYYLALARYRNATGGRQDWNQYVVYSMHLFGLPTQPLKWSDATLQTAALSPSRLAHNAPRGVEDNVITISDFEVSFDDQGRAVFEVPEGGRSAKPFGPVLPVVRRSHLLPWDATNIVVTLTSSEARPYTETVEMQHSQPICYSFGPLTGTFETTGLYPTSLLMHTIFSDVGGLRLDLAVTPLRYDIDTGEVTLYDALTYRITYDSATPAALNDLRVNRAMTVATESVAVPASVTLQTPTPLSGTLVWGFEDGAGNTMGDDVAALNVDAGSTVLSWFFDTQGWQPGEKQLWVSARDEVGQVVASGSTAFKVVQKQYTVYMPLIMKE